MTYFLSKIRQSLALISIFSLTSLWGISKEGEELKILDELIAASERQLALQKQLKILVANFQRQQDLFYQGQEGGQQTKELASKMVNTAQEILKMSEENHYLHLFPLFFVEELKLFAGIAKKNNPKVVVP